MTLAGCAARSGSGATGARIPTIRLASVVWRTAFSPIPAFCGAGTATVRRTRARRARVAFASDRSARTDDAPCAATRTARRRAGAALRVLAEPARAGAASTLARDQFCARRFECENRRA